MSDTLNASTDVGLTVAEAAIEAIADEIEAQLGAHRTFDSELVIELEIDSGLRRALQRGLAAITRDALARIRTGEPLPEALPPDLNRAIRLAAHRRDGLCVITEAHFHEADAVWQQLMDVAERLIEDTRLRWNVVATTRTRLASHSRRIALLVRRAYARETEQLDSSSPSAIPGLVSRALEGERVDAQLLGYELRQRHLAFISDVRETTELTSLAARWDRQLVEVSAPDGVVWAWLGGSDPIGDRDLDRLVEWHHEHGAAVAFGEPADDLAGFRTTHDQALEAWGLASSTGAHVVRYRDVAIQIALVRDPGLLNAFCTRELGLLSGAGPRERELRRVARTYLEHGQNAVATASKLGCSRRTIERKLVQVEGLVDHLLRQRSGELLMALKVADLGDSDCG